MCKEKNSKSLPGNKIKRPPWEKRNYKGLLGNISVGELYSGVVLTI